MICDNKFCVFWESGECIIKEISLDCQGKCMECIYIDIDEEKMKRIRYKQREKYK